MAFESICHKPMPEALLLEQVIIELHANFTKYQSQSFFLKLAQGPEKTTQVIWIKDFPTADLLWEFIFDTTYDRTCILIKFHEDRYEGLRFGHAFSGSFRVWKDSFDIGRTSTVTYDIEKHTMIPRELLEKGFGEITQFLASTKLKKAI